MIQICCVVDEPEAALNAGRELAPDLRLLQVPRLSCVVRPCQASEPAEDEDHLVRHDQLLRRMMLVSTVVPFCYRTVLPSVDEATAELVPRARVFEAAIGRVRGRVELAMRVGPTAATAAGAPAGEGRAYLRTKALNSSMVRRLHGTLTGYAHCAHISVDSKGGASAAYLIDAGRVDEFCGMAVRTANGIDGLSDVSLTGPWPPYTFAGDAWNG